MSDSDQHVLTRADGAVFFIAFNRSDKKNAITAGMYAALVEALEQAHRDSAIRVILFHGTERVFTAGNDLEDFLQYPSIGLESPVFRFLKAISCAEKPLVAAVAGPAVGIGTTMLLHCDLVIAATTARFAMPFVRLGLCPEAASSLLLPRLAGYQRAAEKLFLGEAFDPEEARQMGLVNRIVEPESLMSEAVALAGRLAALPPASLRETKRLMKLELQPAIGQRLVDEAALFSAMLASPAAKEAMHAFFERRTPEDKPHRG